jgi:predicted transcriptional regulator
MRLQLPNPFSRGRISANMRSLGPLELELLQRLWEHGEMSVRDVHANISDRLAYTTVMTTLDRLHKKGLLNRRKDGRAFRYSAAITQSHFSAIAAHEAVASMITFAHPNAADAVSYFVEAISESDIKLLDELERAVKAQKEKERR